MSSKSLNLGARASRPHLDNTCGHAGGTPALPEMAKWASYLRPVPQYSNIFVNFLVVVVRTTNFIKQTKLLVL